MHTHHQPISENNVFDTIILSIPFMFIIFIFIMAVYMANKKYQRWPVYRIVFFIVGILCIASALIGPIAERAHTSFQAHMIMHLLLGMLGPLLISLSAPMTLVLRSLSIKHARRLSKLLKSAYVQFICHPITATILNIGGLWVLYTTDLFSMMHSSIIIYTLVHLHIFLAGYVFTISMIYIDPTPHPTSFYLRACILVIAMAGHSILSKWIYANPPAGVESTDAELGGMMMYYAGDAIDLVIVVILCYQFFKGNSYWAKKAHLLS
ncbi:cytochrome c oxidase assembly protein [Lysinibacillus telephonicus]|uniref:cytochrome c oxidase assembly protein n=1 Tax=Lysinibacillus telephonicus TaxID=1714840 RepID=UPI0031FDE60D